MNDKPLKTVEELKEQLAAIEHERWSDWQKWVHAVYENPTRPFEEAIANWKKQIDTPYEKLSDREKASDMEQVDRYWKLIEDFYYQLMLSLVDSLGYNSKLSRSYFQPTINSKKNHKNGYRLAVRDMKAKLSEHFNGESL